jgi:hypothetical protein
METATSLITVMGDDTKKISLSASAIASRKSWVTNNTVCGRCCQSCNNRFLTSLAVIAEVWGESQTWGLDS